MNLKLLIDTLTEKRTQIFNLLSRYTRENFNKYDNFSYINHPDVLEFDKKIIDLQNRINDIKNEKNSFIAKEQDIIRQYNECQSWITKSTHDLKYEKDKKECDEIENTKKFIEMYKDYVMYQEENEISLERNQDEAGLSDKVLLIKKCNEHHQEQLLDNYHYDEPSSHCDSDCTGWTVGNHRCDCDGYKGWSWNDDGFDPIDLSEFDISATRPYGYAEQGW
jgi:hypothetical protein